MENNPEERLYAYLERRERELTHQLSALKGQIEARETELAHVRSAQRTIGNLGRDDQKRFGVPDKFADPQFNVAAEVGRQALNQVLASLTIKQLIVMALRAHFIPKGATASELRQYIQDAYGRTITHGSISPQLSRLKADGSVQHDDESDKWRLTAVGVLREGKREVPSDDKSKGTSRVTDED